MKKTFTLGFMMLMAAANLSAQSFLKWLTLSEEQGVFDINHISADGKFLGGYATYTGQPVVADWQNEDFKVFTDVEGAEVHWVTNSGLAVGYSNMEGGFKLDFAQSSYTPIDPTDENGVRAQCEAISEDGTIIVGALLDDDWNETACYWENGERKLLPVPTAEELGFEVDGAHAKFISKDGSIIVGYLAMIPVLDPMLIWERQADGTYKCDPVCLEWVRINANSEAQKNNPYKKFTPAALSADGKTIAVHIRDYYDDDAWVWPVQQIGRYDIATKKLEVTTVDGAHGLDTDADYVATGIANDGTIVGYGDGMDRIGVIIKGGSTETITLYDAYNSLIPEFSYFDFFGGHEVRAISEDGRYIAGVGPVMSEGNVFPSATSAYMLDTQDVTTAIQSVNTAKAQTEYYSLDGRKLHAPAKGLNIIKTADGRTQKVIVK